MGEPSTPTGEEPMLTGESFPPPPAVCRGIPGGAAGVGRGTGGWGGGRLGTISRPGALGQPSWRRRTPRLRRYASACRARRSSAPNLSHALMWKLLTASPCAERSSAMRAVEVLVASM
eukprot:scaffold1705_cov79-Isochrysis_galbana.AAC.1